MENHEEKFNSEKTQKRQRFLAAIGAVTLALIAFTAFIFVVLQLARINIASKPEPKTREPEPKTINVVAQEVSMQSLKPMLTSTGTVQAWQESQLAAQVGGRVVWLCDCLETGTQVKTGQTLARIESADYQVALANAEQMVATAEQNILQEEARAEQARLDWQELNLGEPTELALRKPQLAAAEASLESSKVQLQQAKRNLARTTIKAPYAGIITARRSNVGDFINTGASIGSILNTEKVQIELSINANDVYKIDQESTSITLAEAGTSNTWEAQLSRIDGVIDPRTRLLKVIAEVEQPYNTEIHQAVLRVGSFVNARFTGKNLDGIYELPNSALLSDNSLFIVDRNNTLQKHHAEIRHRNLDTVMVSIPSANGQSLQVVTEGQAALIPDTEVVILDN